MKKLLCLLLLAANTVFAQTFPVQNLQVLGTANISGQTTAAGVTATGLQVNGNATVTGVLNTTSGTVNAGPITSGTISATGVSVTSLTNGSSTFYPTVATNAGLTALSTAVSPVVTRLGFYSSGDSPAITYYASGSACPLNSGAGDNGSQVKSANNLCWLAQLPQLLNVRIWGAHVDGSTDDSVPVQAAITYASNNTGGTVFIPKGYTVLNAGVTVAIGGVTIEGDGWQEYSGVETSGTPGSNGSFILSTTTAASPITFANTVENAKLINIGFIQNQPADTSGWTPTIYPPTISIQGANFSSGAVDIENVFCWKCYSFISMGSTGNFVGRITLKHLWGQPLANGISIVAASDTVLVDDVHFWPFASANLNIAAWVQANGVGINIYRADNPIITNMFVYGMNAGIIFQSSTDGSSQHFQFSNIAFDSVNQGIFFQEGAHGANGQISNIYVQAPSGAAATTSGITVSSGVTGLTMDVTNFRSSASGGSCYNAVGSSDVSIVNTWCDNWNVSNTGVNGLFANVGNTLTLGGRLRANGGNGAALTGGTGTFNISHVN